MPFRNEINKLYPRAIQELTRRGVGINYIAINEKFELTNKQGNKKIVDHSELEKLENKLTVVGGLNKVDIELTDELL